MSDPITLRDLKINQPAEYPGSQHEFKPRQRGSTKLPGSDLKKHLEKTLISNIIK